ncbi:hypothetical protein GMO_15340 [Gluconobacter morbifer G707]|uniref:Uncharacterized protein n=1 Tax=Gluconobacter morbifer G707 TaxID=1088869 RepID=G6XJ68_9PROT|nr:hypothetical protein GMO_15340 [Gluconobacter morbifer G707]
MVSLGSARKVGSFVPVAFRQRLSRNLDRVLKPVFQKDLMQTARFHGEAGRFAE